MSPDERIALLGGWEGYRVGTAQRFEADETRRRPEVLIELHPRPGEGMACSGCGVVATKVHDVVAKFGREVIDRVRVDQANRLRKNKAARQVVKGSRWLLLRNRSNLPTDDDRIRLSELLAANKPLMTFYVLREDLKRLWNSGTTPTSS